MSEQQNTPPAESQEPHGTDEHGKPNEEQETETPSVEDLLTQIEDLKKESRKWEGRAKANKTAADELAEIKRSQMTDAEKAEADRAEVEKRVADAEERASKAEAALARYEIATEFGLDKDDVEALSKIEDPDTLRVLAQRLADRSPSGPKPNPSQGRRSTKPAPSTPAQAFADALEDLF